MKKLYVVVRDDLSTPQKAVQAGHALAEYLLKTKTDWRNGTLVYLKTKDEFNLKKLVDKLDMYGIIHNTFCEPDLDNELTAVASVDGKRVFRKLELL